jgi:hypothetical protein
MYLQIEPKNDHWEVQLMSMHSLTLAGAIKDMEKGMEDLKKEYETLLRDRKKDAVPLLCPPN